MKKGVDYIGVAAGAVIVNNEGKLFLSLRGKEARNERGKWEFPGGGVKFGEKLEDAVIREMKEEYGVQIEVLELLDVCSHFIPEEKQHWVASTYICKLVSGEPKILEPHKCEQIGWFTLEEVKSLPVSIITRYDITQLEKKYPRGITLPLT